MPPVQPPLVPSCDELARAVKNVPSGPRILPRLQRLLRDSDVSVEQILEPIRVDQGIAARVLQVSNSAAYSKGSRCQSIEESINRLGLKRVYHVVSSAMCSDSLVRPLATYGLKAEEFWKLSLATGLAAETLAVQTGEDHNAAYTIGLLHGLGMVVIDSWLQPRQPGVRLMYRDFRTEYTVDEMKVLNFTQAEAAAAMLRFWDFPSEMTGPLAFQYRSYVPAEHQRMVALLRCAKWLRNLASGIYPPADDSVDTSQLQLLGVHQSQLDSMLDEIRGRMQESRDMLSAS